MKRTIRLTKLAVHALTSAIYVTLLLMIAYYAIFNTLLAPIPESSPSSKPDVMTLIPVRSQP